VEEEFFGGILWDMWCGGVEVCVGFCGNLWDSVEYLRVVIFVVFFDGGLRVF